MLATRRRPLTLLFLVSLGHVLIISMQVQTEGGLSLLQGLLFGAAARIERGVAAVADAGRAVWTRYVGLTGVAGENEALRRRILELEGELQAARALAAEMRALESALGLQRRVDIRTLAARVIGGDPSGRSLTVTIDRGQADGVEADLAVIAPGGVVGRIVGRPAARAAQVQLLVSSQAAAAAVLETSGLGGLVVGTGGSPALRMQYLSARAPVTPGERVLTTGQDGIYPAGFTIGTVERVEAGTGLDRVLVVRPAVEYSGLDVVLVVLTRPGSGGTP